MFMVMMAWTFLQPKHLKNIQFMVHCIIGRLHYQPVPLGGTCPAMKNGQLSQLFLVGKMSLEVK